MFFIKNTKVIEKYTLAKLVIHYIMVVLLTLLCSLLLNRYWSAYTGLYHTVVELLCVFIALSTFLVIWYTYKEDIGISPVMFFGFLAVAIFDMFHIYYFPGLGFYPSGYYDLSTRYWILGRLSEAIILLMGTLAVFDKRINKYAGAALSLAIAICLSYIVLNTPSVLPVMLTERGVTLPKVIIEYIIIAMFLINAFMLAKSKLNAGNHGAVAYEYIFIALLTASLAEFYFTLFDTIDSFYYVFGHFLKVVYYFYIFRGVFISAITFPYKEVEEKNKYINNILDELPVAFIKYDRDRKLSLANKKAMQLMEYCLDDTKNISTEHLADSFFKTLDGTENIFISQDDRAFKPVRNKIRTVINKWGRIAKLKVDGHVLENGDYICLIEEARKEQELEDLQLQTQTILNSIKSMILIVNRENKVVMCNKAFQYEFGLQKGEFIGMDVNEFKSRIGFIVNSDSEFPSEQGTNSVREISFISPKGDRKELVFHSSPIYNVHGEYIGSIDTAYDVTEYKKEQQKLQHQEKLSLIGQMASGIVHQIKNPLSAIKGFSQILKLKSDEQKVREYAALIDTSADEINKFVMSFLDLSRPHPSVYKETSINGVVQSISMVLKDYYSIKGIRYSVDTTEQEKLVVADEDKIRQVILNIVSNAVDALSGRSDPEISVKTIYDYNDDSMVVYIKDNGKGMSEEVRKNIGTPFFTTKENGTGLGMSICYQIINEHRGSIEVESQIGKGTCFKIKLSCGEVPGHKESIINQSPISGQSMYSLNSYINLE